MVIGRSLGAQITFGEQHRPEEATHVRLESFDGPLAVLLSLIEQRQLDVLTVRLGDLAGAYLEAVARLDDRRLPLLSAFVAVCSQLILIKSRALLPRPPADDDTQVVEEAADPEEELRARLLLYRRYRDAGQLLALRLDGGGLYRREPAAALAAGLAGAQAPVGPPLETALLSGALAGLLRITPPPPPRPEVIRRVVTLDDRAAAIRQALRGAPVIVLQELLRDVRDRVVWAVTFLAMLELVKGRELAIEQDAPWGPIRVRPMDRAGDEAAE